MNPNRYRPDIDGLRAIAVLGVVFYHLGLKQFSGGFIGVDIFFVISGFLITRLILNALEEGAFSFSQFYARRARRLFPALFFTLALSALLATILFVPQDLERFGGALLHSILSVSNFYFWSEASYFGAHASVKPLLHTWSLSVEEQFYLVWPLLFCLLIKHCKVVFTALVIAALGALGFYFAVQAIQQDPEAVFYLAPYRVFEFSIGALMVWLVAYQPKQKVLLEPLLLLGLAMVIYPMITHPSKSSFSVHEALWPCLGAALIIYSGKAPILGRVLSNRLLVGIGLISYSLYLIHWPFIVFYKYWRGGIRLDSWAILLIFVLSTVSAVAMYFFIEKPFRQRAVDSKPLSASAFGLVCALCALVLCLPAAHMWAEHGWEWRFDKSLIQAVGRADEMRVASWKYIRKHNSIAARPFTTASSNKILVIGDSHSKDVFNAVYLNRELIPGVEVRQLTLNDSCLFLFADGQPPAKYSALNINECEIQAQKLSNNALISEADLILLSSRWTALTITWIQPFIERLRLDRKLDVIILGRTAEFANVPKFVLNGGLHDGLETELALVRNTRLDAINTQLFNIAKQIDVPYFDKAAVICGGDRSRCTLFDEAGNIAFYDYGHWSVEGAAFFGRKMIEAGMLAK